MGVSESQITHHKFPMLFILRFLWNSTRGHHFTPWRSPYLRWRIETYCGVKMDKIGFFEFWGFLFRQRMRMWQFLKWIGKMENYVQPNPRNV